MSVFNWLKDVLEGIKAQDCEVDPEVSDLVENYYEQALKADRRLQEKQARDRQERKPKRRDQG